MAMIAFQHVFIGKQQTGLISSLVYSKNRNMSHHSFHWVGHYRRSKGLCKWMMTAKPQHWPSSIPTEFRSLWKDTKFGYWLECFQGDFDNFHQVVEERVNNVFPREGGGHEHIHCNISPLFCKPNGHVLLFAKYYFNGNPNVVFRFRVYEVFPSVSPDNPNEQVLEMKILRFYETASSLLRERQYDIFSIPLTEDNYEYLNGCEVYWRYEHVAHEQVKQAPHFIGWMKGGGCSVYSPETKAIIHVKDDLILTKDNLWVNDRGFDDCQNYIYGNQRGIHYKMKRVLPGGDLEWTLGKTNSKPLIAKEIEQLDKQYKLSK